ncbi:hypothetical protein Cob_v003449 [Colletotrichum orbiculare MAFF 240422]|uniref:Uncharacterized protein n=1 Tax=Colletotrichum orbiculare (strain 104-T / ATCC 96160 / CBS 514.97 / LARS 414 / MAFF 240422) TaxID=1213857 RepID=A0A484G484_COLOR|nr:hypothetical protein Cob_v003449 [Colletotrichum orbiculare MAFF 240422]
MGVLAGVTGIMKAVQGYRLMDVRSPENMYNQAVYWVWSMAEPNVTVISASIPVLRGFVRNVRKRTESSPGAGAYVKTGDHSSKFYNKGDLAQNPLKGLRPFEQASDEERAAYADLINSHDLTVPSDITENRPYSALLDMRHRCCLMAMLLGAKDLVDDDDDDDDEASTGAEESREPVDLIDAVIKRLEQDLSFLRQVQSTRTLLEPNQRSEHVDERQRRILLDMDAQRR